MNKIKHMIISTGSPTEVIPSYKQPVSVIFHPGFGKIRNEGCSTRPTMEKNIGCASNTTQGKSNESITSFITMESVMDPHQEREEVPSFQARKASPSGAIRIGHYLRTSRQPPWTARTKMTSKPSYTSST